MREIKFKAWDDKNKIMLNTDTPNLLIHFNGEINSFGKNGEINGVYFTNQVKLLQYTGLKDKNGKEIYEGDIVKYMNFIDDIYNEEIGLCKFEQDECNFCIQRIVINNENYPVPTTIRTIYLISNLTYSDDVSYEVIGNIYENPELLAR